MTIILDNPHIIVSMIIAFIFSISQVLFGQYKLNHKFLLKKYGYLILYGIYFSIICLIINMLIFGNEMKINTYDVVGNKWKTAILIGLLIQSIANINIFSFKIDSKEYYVGTKIFNDLFIDFFDEKISNIIDEGMLIEIKRVEKQLKKKTLNQLDILIGNCLPNNLSEIKRVSHIREINNCCTKFDKLRYVAVKFGVKRMNQIVILLSE